MLSKENRATFWWVLFIIIAVVMTVLFLLPRYKQLHEEQAKVKKLQSELTRLQQENTRLRTKVDNLQNSPAEVERTAREKYNMAQKGETVWISESEKEK
ncbi:MAG: septum formation initiator family protein [Lentisphaerae bacterium]|nr:septum formation initiator family protein [Lentisphaerota bacterium]